MKTELDKEKANFSKVKKGLLSGSFLIVIAGIVFKFVNGPYPEFFFLLGIFLFVIWVLVSLSGQNRIQIMELQIQVSELKERLSKNEE